MVARSQIHQGTQSNENANDLAMGNFFQTFHMLRIRVAYHLHHLLMSCSESREWGTQVMEIRVA